MDVKEIVLYKMSQDEFVKSTLVDKIIQTYNKNNNILSYNNYLFGIKYLNSIPDDKTKYVYTIYMQHFGYTTVIVQNNEITDISDCYESLKDYLEKVWQFIEKDINKPQSFIDIIKSTKTLILNPLYNVCDLIMNDRAFKPYIDLISYKDNLIQEIDNECLDENYDKCLTILQELSGTSFSLGSYLLLYDTSQQMIDETLIYLRTLDEYGWNEV